MGSFCHIRAPALHRQSLILAAMELVLPGVVLIIAGLFVLVSFVLWIVALMDLLRSDFRGSNEKLVWLLVIFFAPFLGPILYLVIGRKN
jgi:hypothetical protein